ncbi:hypothetical protein [Herbiconiux flava]|uniref:Uncharacterized protein n=1 Tax=Herbiconiux flava TaxID=881268 RepID=A0A852SI20_9MICO|nr:hypothetical protein [Herbiconiux flava]NYD68870.1 hypothetical protein [Herbiconiux flava]GLK15612.1 hypothetical protein GCM10017602_00940 [Herbiconiux flava]
MTNRVELDLTSNDRARYSVLVGALEEQAERFDDAAANAANANPDGSNTANTVVESWFRARAEIARALIGEINSQYIS